MFCACLLMVPPAFAGERLIQLTGPGSTEPGQTDGAYKLIGHALELIGIKYRSGGRTSETGFDCSGFVGHVYRETLGLVLPRTAHEISRFPKSCPRCGI